MSYLEITFSWTGYEEKLESFANDRLIVMIF